MPTSPGLVANSLTLLQNNRVFDVMFREVLGINVPKVILTRTPTERFDSAVAEASNTIGFFGLGFVLNSAFNQVAKLAKVPLANPKPGWVLGKSLALYSTLSALMYAIPFARNALTSMRTGMTSFSDVVGETNTYTLQGQRTAAQKNQLDYYRQMTTRIMALGVAGTVGALAAGVALAKRPQGLGKLGMALHDLLAMPRGSIRNFAPIKPYKIAGLTVNYPALWFWGVPCYLGYLHAARDRYEWKEQALKFANFVVGFFFLPELVSKPLMKLSPSNALVKQLDGVKNTAYLGSTLASLAMLSGTLVANFWLTHRRVKEGAHQPALPGLSATAQAALQPKPLPSRPLPALTVSPPPLSPWVLPHPQPYSRVPTQALSRFTPAPPLNPPGARLQATTPVAPSPVTTLPVHPLQPLAPNTASSGLISPNG